MQKTKVWLKCNRMHAIMAEIILSLPVDCLYPTKLTFWPERQMFCHSHIPILTLPYWMLLFALSFSVYVVVRLRNNSDACIVFSANDFIYVSEMKVNLLLQTLLRDPTIAKRKQRQPNVYKRLQKACWFCFFLSFSSKNNNNNADNRPYVNGEESRVGRNFTISNERMWVVSVYMCKLMSMPDGITWVGQKSERSRMFSIWILNCVRTLSSLVRMFLLVFFYTLLPPPHAKTVLCCVCSYIQRSHRTKQNSLNDLSRAT